VSANPADTQAPVTTGGLTSARTAPIASAATPAAGVKVPAHERIVLSNGMTLIVMPRHDIPLVSFNAVLRGGESAAAPGKSGVASLVAGLLEKGAGKRDAFAFVDAVEGVGGTFNAAAGPESIAIRGQFLARDQQLMLELLADALLRPRFKLEELENLRDRQIELIKAAKDSDPSELIGRQIVEHLDVLKFLARRFSLRLRLGQLPSKGEKCSKRHDEQNYHQFDLCFHNLLNSSS